MTQLMLVRASNEHAGQMRAVSPEVGLADLLARQEADLADRQAQLAVSRAAVTRMVADCAQTRATHGERLLGMDAVQDRLARLGRATTTEVLGVNPGAQRPEDYVASRVADDDVLTRGVTMNTLYRDAIRNDPAATAYAHWLLSRGGEVRTAPVLPQRMVIIDRAQALVPIDPSDGRKGALHVTEPASSRLWSNSSRRPGRRPSPWGRSGPRTRPPD
ncbi:hypothetical protein [Streptacidiphilus sp. PAMC 29251]